MSHVAGARRSIITSAIATALLWMPGCTASSPAGQDAGIGSDVGRDTPAQTPFEYFGGLRLNDDIPSPADALGYDIGDHFTRQADMFRYFETLAERSSRVRMLTYGQTHQRRPLVLLVISDEANLDRIDAILDDNRRLADPTTDKATADRIIRDNPAIAWFSYNVHGNEASASEGGMAVAHTLAAGLNDEIRTILKDVVVVIDPMLNPDGHERYVNWYQNATGQRAITNPDSTEHVEPWPGGRTNHYLFDLNRDWLWLVQPESRQRLVVYRQFLPQLHIDHHEQGYTSPFFMGEGDTPYNANLSTETLDWVARYGEANAEAFDAHELEYSTRERFDWLYPGYGKVLPSYHGAIGMLVEQGGHSRAGRAIRVLDRYTLTLRDRAHHHWLITMSNLETTAALRREQLERFRRYFVDSCDPDILQTRTYVISADADPLRLELARTLLTSQGIEVDVLDQDTRIADATELLTGESGGRTLPAGSWVIDINQPMGRLANAILEADPVVTDKETYDITAWSMPIAFGLAAWVVDGAIDANTSPLSDKSPTPGEVTGDGDLAVLVDSTQFAFPRILAMASQFGLWARLADETMTIGDHTFSPGSLIVHAAHNDADRVELFIEACTALHVDVHRTGSGLTDDGPVLSANANQRFEAPRVLLARGRPLSGNSYGQFWHMLDIAYPVAHSAVDIDRLRSIDLDAYGVIVIPDAGGGLTSALGGEGTEEKIKDWIRSGGVVVATGGSATWASRSLLGLDDAPTPNHDDAHGDEDDATPRNTLSWKERDERRINQRVPGALVRVDVDTTHPMAAGVAASLGVIKRGTRVLPLRDDGFAVARFSEGARIGGSMSEENEDFLAGQPFITHHGHGSGAVICFADDVTFRGFQHAPMRLLLNAIMTGPSLPRSGGREHDHGHSHGPSIATESE